MRWIPFALVVAMGSGCRGSARLSHAYVPLLLADGMPACADRLETGECRLYEASFIQLIARPELYDGKRVRLLGFANLEFEGNALYLSNELYKNGNSRDAVWLDVESITSPPRFRRGYALVEGTFAAGPAGHFGMFSGSIGKITRFERAR